MNDAQKPALIVLPCAILAIAIICLAVILFDTPRMDWRHAARWTADFSSLLFLSIFVPQFRHIAPQISRRQRVLGFVTAHFIHAGAFLTYHLVSVAPRPLTVVLGGGGYLLITALVLVPPPSAPRLHQFGIWYVWLIFLATFATGIGDAERQLGASIGVAAFIAAALARLAFSIAKSGRRE